MYYRPGDFHPVARSMIPRLHTGCSNNQHGDQQQSFCDLVHTLSPMIKFHFDAGKNSIFYEFELSKIL
ncbi:hypothetical protein, partial [uncultured Victivallis sp.]|uniref:hypothetical protein n=1 Tax=uncultured Victivallis sp. TaxID=354118 RepID=UPI0025D5C29B